MKKLILTLTLIAGGFIMANAQNAPAKPAASAPSSNTTMKVSAVQVSQSEAAVADVAPAADAKKECKKDAKACGDKKEGKSCCAGKKAEAKKAE